jgi:hypothetical protein
MIASIFFNGKTKVADTLILQRAMQTAALAVSLASWGGKCIRWAESPDYTPFLDPYARNQRYN